MIEWWVNERPTYVRRAPKHKTSELVLDACRHIPARKNEERVVFVITLVPDTYCFVQSSRATSQVGR